MIEEEARAWVAQHVSRETLVDFDAYATLLRKWQRAINLVSRNTLDTVYERHIADSLQVFQARDRSEGRWLDIGSGAGFPGLICATVAMREAPDLTFALIESDQRKTAFLREVVRALELKVDIIAARIEDTPPQGADIVSARALAPLTKLCELCQPHLSADGIALFPKGRNHGVEQTDADRVWRMHREIIPSRLDPDSVIYRIGELARV